MGSDLEPAEVALAGIGIIDALAAAGFLDDVPGRKIARPWGVGDVVGARDDHPVELRQKVPDGRCILARAERQDQKDSTANRYAGLFHCPPPDYPIPD